jgi:hypothetical protein
VLAPGLHILVCKYEIVTTCKWRTILSGSREASEMNTKAIAVDRTEVLRSRLFWLAAVSGYFIVYRLFLDYSTY